MWSYYVPGSLLNTGIWSQMGLNAHVNEEIWDLIMTRDNLRGRQKGCRLDLEVPGRLLGGGKLQFDSVILPSKSPEMALRCHWPGFPHVWRWGLTAYGGAHFLFAVSCLGFQPVLGTLVLTGPSLESQQQSRPSTASRLTFDFPTPLHQQLEQSSEL